MSLRPNSKASRIVAALRQKPMTVRELADMLVCTDDHTRVVVAQLERKQLVRRAGTARTGQSGTAPYVWEAA